MTTLIDMPNENEKLGEIMLQRVVGFLLVAFTAVTAVTAVVILVEG